MSSDRDPRLSQRLVDGALDLSGAGEIRREFYGYAGAGPLAVSLYSEHPDDHTVHVSWGDGGMFLTPREARELACFILAVESAARGG